MAITLPIDINKVKGFLDPIEGEALYSYAKKYNLAIDQTDLKGEALEWSMTRGSRSGRVAWQFIQDLAGKQGKKLTNDA